MRRLPGGFSSPVPSPITVLADWIRRATDQWSVPAAQSAGLT
jgi:hypothetical protein